MHSNLTTIIAPCACLCVSLFENWLVKNEFKFLIASLYKDSMSFPIFVNNGGGGDLNTNL